MRRCISVSPCVLLFAAQEKDDCTHWCHPSGYQVWIAELYEVLRQQLHNIPLPPLHSMDWSRKHAEQLVSKPSR